MKNSKRRDAILHHEVAHLRKQSINPNIRNDDEATSSVYDTTYMASKREHIKNNKNKDYNDREKDFKNQMKNFSKENYLKTAVPNNHDEKLEYINKKYIYDKFPSDSHTNAYEIEADQEAAKKVGQRTLIKALREGNKQNKNKLKKKYGNKDKKVKIYNTKSEADYITRSKALRDKTLKDMYGD